jgi:hypothetical protein
VRMPARRAVRDAANVWRSALHVCTVTVGRPVTQPLPVFAARLNGDESGASVGIRSMELPGTAACAARLAAPIDTSVRGSGERGALRVR